MGQEFKVFAMRYLVPEGPLAEGTYPLMFFENEKFIGVLPENLNEINPHFLIYYYIFCPMVETRRTILKK